MEIIKVGRQLSPCSGCGNREMCQYYDGSKWICDDCHEGPKKAEVKPRPEQNTVDDYDDIDSIGQMTLVLSGKAYDLVERKEKCEHSEIKIYDGLKGKRSNFCNVCGQKLLHRKAPTKRKKLSTST